MGERLEALEAIEEAVWQQLQTASRDPAHGWRTPVLATVALDADGVPAGDARTVVLREVDVAARRLRVYTDSRAAKVGQLRSHRGATLMMWSRELGWQVRCRVACTVVDDGLAVSSRWARVRLSPTAAHDYLAPQAPGAVLQPSAAGPVARREHFAMIDAQVVAIDWLELHPAGHRRARFEARAGTWLQP